MGRCSRSFAGGAAKGDGLVGGLGVEERRGLTVEVGLVEAAVGVPVVAAAVLAVEESVLVLSAVLLGVEGLVLMLVMVLIVVREVVKEMGGSDLVGPENLFMAPRMAIRTPVMPTVQIMMAIQLLREISLYQGGSAGSTQTSSCRTGSLLLPAVPGRMDESAEASLAPSPLRTADVDATPAKMTSGKGFGRVSAYW